MEAPLDDPEHIRNLVDWDPSDIDQEVVTKRATSQPWEVEQDRREHWYAARQWTILHLMVNRNP